MSKVTTTLHSRWLKTPGYKEAFDASQAEFELARQLIESFNRPSVHGDDIKKEIYDD